MAEAKRGSKSTSKMRVQKTEAEIGTGDTVLAEP